MIQGGRIKQTMNTTIKPNQETGTEPPAGKDLVEQIFDTMLQVPGGKPGYRPVHAKGIVCQGSFVPTREAATLQSRSFPNRFGLPNGALLGWAAFPFHSG